MASGKRTFTLEWVSEDCDFFAAKDDEGCHKAGRNMKPRNFRKGEKCTPKAKTKGPFISTELALLTRCS